MVNDPNMEQNGLWPDPAQLLSMAGIASLKEIAGRFLPFHRSQSGTGIEKTFDLLGEYVDLQVDCIPSGTRVGDWTVPQQWDFRSARITDSNGKIIVDTELFFL